MIVVGVLSGTSADGITVAIAEILHEQTEDGAQDKIPPISIKQLAFETIPWPAAERELIFNMFSGSSLTLQQMCQANFQLGRTFAEAVIKVVENNGFKLSDIDLIGSHGQTVWHDVTAANTVSSTLQIGEPAVIAEMTGVTTVADFRVADVAAGGHGAPLVPIFDSIMLGSKDKSDSWRAHQNIGGIGNVTLLPPTNATEKPIGFDTGPGNVLMDWYTSKMTNGELQYDLDGKLAVQGKVNEKLLHIMLEHPYFATKPPKTTGRELFTFKLGEEWLKHKDELSMTDHDFLATLTELTAVSITKAYKTWCPGHLERVTVAGGGSRNPYLMKRIQFNIEKEFPLVDVASLDENRSVSFSSEAKEALLFALLAWMAIHGYDVGSVSGYGECGLPPKKPGVYYADFNDIKTYIEALDKKIKEVAHVHESSSYNPFNDFDNKYFTFMHVKEIDSTQIKALRALFRALDECPLNAEKFSCPARNAVEIALFDAWGKITNKPIYELIGIEPAKKRGFYTAALNKEIDLIVEATTFGLQYTPNIKIKLNRDIALGSQIVNRLVHLFKEKVDPHVSDYVWSIDANSDWTPAVAMEFLNNIVLNKEHPFTRCYMLEQPFSAHLTPEEFEEWKVVRQEYSKHGILIFADESIHNATQVEELKDIIDGANVKMDKAGGYREALRTILKAQELNKKVWIGMMVASSLSTVAHLHLLPLSTVGGDLDGSLLVKDTSDPVTAIPWAKFGSSDYGLIAPWNKPGIGVDKK